MQCFLTLAAIRMGGTEENLKTPDAYAAPQTQYIRISGVRTQATVFLNAYQAIPTWVKFENHKPKAHSAGDLEWVGAGYVRSKTKTLILSLIFNMIINDTAHLELTS